MCLDFFSALFDPCFAMDTFRSTHIDRSNSLPPRSDSSRADLVVERPLTRLVDLPHRPPVYYDQELSSRQNGLQYRATTLSQSITSHPAGFRLNSTPLEAGRGNLDIGLNSDRAHSQHTLSSRQRAVNHELPRSISPSTDRPTMRLVSAVRWAHCKTNNRMRSAVAVSFDPRMEMGVPRSTYTWHSMQFLL